MAVTIYTPVEGYTGVVAGVAFAEGKAELDELTPAQRRYFRQAGYGFDEPAPPVEVPESADPRLVGTDGDGIEALGTPLRDAAIDPRRGDFLPPTNAGAENPHGPLVVSPELHGSQGVRPVRGGEVERGGAHEAAETAHAAEHTGIPDGDQGDQPLERPNVRDGKSDWVTYAIRGCGADPDEAAAMTKDELIKTYGKES